MSRFAGLTKSVACASLATVLTAVSAYAADSAPPYGSTATIAAIGLTSGSMGTDQTVSPVSGNGSPAYRQIATDSGPDLSLPLGGGLTPLLLTVSTPQGKTRASGRKVAGEQSYIAVGKTTIHSLKLQLATQAVVPVNLLLIKATHLKTEVTATTLLSGKETVDQKSIVGALTISGLLVGTPVTLTGKLKPGIVVNTPLLTITVDDVTKSTSNGQKDVSVAAVDIDFLGGAIQGVPLSGHVLLSIASAY